MKMLEAQFLTGAASAILDDGKCTLPKSGDIWVLSWDGNDLGLVVIGYVGEDYVSTLPITLDASSVHRSSLPTRIAARHRYGCLVVSAE
jgi:hypothetical protein